MQGHPHTTTHPCEGAVQGGTFRVQCGGLTLHGYQVTAHAITTKKHLA